MCSFRGVTTEEGAGGLPYPCDSGGKNGNSVNRFNLPPENRGEFLVGAVVLIYECSRPKGWPITDGIEVKKWSERCAPAGKGGKEGRPWLSRSCRQRTPAERPFRSNRWGGGERGYSAAVKGGKK